MPKPTFRKKADNDDNSSISKFSNGRVYVGDIRKTQLITTFGVGSIVDFKDDTVIIASTDDWDYNPKDAEEVDNRKIFNENLSIITGAEYFLMPRTAHSTNSFSKGKMSLLMFFPKNSIVQDAAISMISENWTSETVIDALSVKTILMLPALSLYALTVTWTISPMIGGYMEESLVLPA